MKTSLKTLIVLIVASLLIISCEKNDEIIVENDNPFIGTWDWTENSDVYSNGYTFTDTTFVNFDNEGGNEEGNGERSGVYSYTDEKITLTFQPESGNDYSHEHDYSINGNVLTMYGDEFNKRD